MKATKVNAGLAESNGRLLLGLWRDSLHVTCGLTACTPGSATGPTLGNEYGKTLPFSVHEKIRQFLSSRLLKRCTQKLVPFFCLTVYNILVIVRPIIAASTRPIFTKFARLLDLWPGVDERSEIIFSTPKNTFFGPLLAGL